MKREVCANFVVNLFYHKPRTTNDGQKWFDLLLTFVDNRIKETAERVRIIEAN